MFQMPENLKYTIQRLLIKYVISTISKKAWQSFNVEIFVNKLCSLSETHQFINIATIHGMLKVHPHVVLYIINIEPLPVIYIGIIHSGWSIAVKSTSSFQPPCNEATHWVGSGSTCFVALITYKYVVDLKSVIFNAKL